VKTLLNTIALLGLLLLSVTFADELTPTVSLETFRGEAKNHPTFEAVVELASLPATKVLLQHTCDRPPAVGGFETVFEQGGMHYTCWLWKDAETKQNRFRVYYYPAGKRSELRILDDTNVDGVINVAFKKDDETVGDVLQLQPSTTTHPTPSEVVHLPKDVVDTEKARFDVLRHWADQHFNVISNIRAQVYLANYKKLKPGDPSSQKNVYDELGRLVCTLHHGPNGLFMEEWAYDAAGNRTHSRMRILKEEK